MKNSIIDINEIYKQIENLSLFDLTRLKSAINQLLNNEEKNFFIKKHLTVGMRISYFHGKYHTTYDGVVISVSKNKASIKNALDDEVWMVPFCAINISDKDIIHINKCNTKTLDKYSLSVGAQVGFKDRCGRDVFGIVKKLNSKTAIVELKDGHIWQVYYPHLFLVMDGVAHDSNEMLFIEGEIINN